MTSFPTEAQVTCSISPIVEHLPIKQPFNGLDSPTEMLYSNQIVSKKNQKLICDVIQSTNFLVSLFIRFFNVSLNSIVFYCSRFFLRFSLPPQLADIGALCMNVFNASTRRMQTFDTNIADWK